MIVFEGLELTKEQIVKTFEATAGQTAFILDHHAVGAVVFTRNGQTLPTTAYSVAGDTVTFLPAGTGSDINAPDASDSTMQAGDLVTIIYFREVQ